MFSKKKCGNCGEKIGDSYNFCPYCRAPVKDVFDEEDWGLLGKNDAVSPDEIRLPMGLNALFNSLVNNLNNQLKEIEMDKTGQNKKSSSKKSGGISISISTAAGKQPEIKVRSFGNAPKLKEKAGKKKETIKLPIAETGKFSGLPKMEPETEIRKFSDTVLYEIKLPGVKSVDDISLSQLENSIEIKALANKKVFYKVIPINLPIRNYNLSKGVLTLELDSTE